MSRLNSDRKACSRARLTNESLLVRKTQAVWSERLGRPVSEEEAIEMISGAKQLLDLLREEHKGRRRADNSQNTEKKGAINTRN